MRNHYTDFDELRPTGEALHTPDSELNERAGTESRRRRAESNRTGYPGVPPESTTNCRSCGIAIPSELTKCRFCLTHHLDDESVSTGGTADATLLGIAHMVVESTTIYGAIAKGGAAANLLVSNEAEPAIDDYTLLYDLDEAPAPQLADRWPSLPDAVQVASAEGEELLEVACNRTGWSGHGASEHHQPVSTRLYDQRGTGIRDESRLRSILDGGGDDAWLVPALALTETTGEDETDSQPSSGPATEHLDCQNCEQATDHRFKTYESVPDETWNGQPIWECRVCGAARYGPSFEQRND